MKYAKMVIIVISLFSISCMRIDESAKTRCYIGRIKISKQSYLGSYNIYVSLKLINNTSDTLFFPTNDSIDLPVFPRSAFVGHVLHDSIIFRELRRRDKIYPKDSISILLFSTYYKPKTTDSIFLKEIQKVDVEYEYPVTNYQDKNRYIKKIHIQRTPKTKFEILEDNKSIEGIFLFGNEEFR
jgi:hypothetical protein